MTTGNLTTERTDPPLAGDEAATLLGFLGYHRATLRRKTEGLSAEQLNATLAPAAMTLGGLLKHLAFVEHWWFSCILRGDEFGAPWDTVDWDADEDWDWHSAAGDTPAQLRAILDDAIADSDLIVSEAVPNGLDQLSVRPSRSGESFSLRWIIVHLIEEYARHNGHADLIRESIDGQTGE